MGGRGSSSYSGGGGTGGINASDILSTRDLVGEIGSQRELVAETLDVFKDFRNEYGAQVNEIQLAELKPGTNALAYYDADGNIAINEKYFNNAIMDKAYQQCVDTGFHPGKGSKTAIQAVTAHELGHKLTADVAAKMGMTSVGSLDMAATRIVQQALGKGAVTSKNKISGYAKHSYAEAVAEAMCDVYCNGAKAASESRKIVNVINSYLK